MQGAAMTDGVRRAQSVLDRLKSPLEPAVAPHSIVASRLFVELFAFAVASTQ